jgi:hypothetical protein
MSTTEIQTQAQQPDISYHPDPAKYKLRTERLKSQRPKAGLPTGFPKQLKGPIVWEGKDFTDEKQWTLCLSEDNLKEIHEALLYFKSGGRPLKSNFLLTIRFPGLNKPTAHVSQSTFPLPVLSHVLRQHAQTLHSGRGFFVLRGLTPDKYDIADNITIYTGISSYIGRIRGRQDDKIIDGNPRSQMLNHIKDLSHTSVAGQIGAPAYTTDKQVFHTDQGDIVSLFALNTARSGGESRLASSWRVYNELASTRPDLIETLSQDWDFDGYATVVFCFEPEIC